MATKTKRKTSPDIDALVEISRELLRLWDLKDGHLTTHFGRKVEKKVETFRAALAVVAPSDPKSTHALNDTKAVTDYLRHHPANRPTCKNPGSPEYCGGFTRDKDE